MKMMILSLALLVFSTVTAGHDNAADLRFGSSADTSLLGIMVNPRDPSARPPPTADTLIDLGASQVRVEFRAPNGLSDAFTTYDPLLNQYSQRGISTLLLIDYESLPGFHCEAPDFLTNYAPQFIERARAVASHYVDLGINIAAYEIWNEEDVRLQKDGYCPYVDRHQYAQLLAQTANALSAVIPRGTQIVMGGLGGRDGSYLPDVIRDMGPDWATIDVVGIHPYTYWPSDEGGHGRPSMPVALAAEDTGGKPIWLTEHGDDDLSTQSEYVSTFLSYFDSHRGLIDRAFLFAWSDVMRDRHPYGVYNSAGERKPSWWAFHYAVYPPVIDREIICRDVQNCEATEIVERPMTISRSGGVFYAGVRARIAPGHSCAFRLEEFLGYNCGIFGQSFTSGSYTEGGIIVPFTVDPAPYPVDQYSGRLVSLCDGTATPCINANLVP